MSPPPVFIRDEGTGPPVVLLHAFPLDSTMWDPQVAVLRGHHRVLRPDFWGCGESPAPGEEHSIDDFAAEVLKGLTSLGVPRFALCGLSMGGYVAFAMLRRAPQRITRLVLAGTRASADGDEAKAERRAIAAAVRSEGVDVIVDSMLGRLLSDFGRNKPEVVAFVRQRMLASSPAGVAAAEEAMAERADSTDLLGTITCPTRLISGTADPVVPTGEMRAMAAAIPGARCIAIEDAGHLANLETSSMFTDLLDEHIDGES